MAAVALLPQMLVMMPLTAAAASLSLRFGQRRLTTLGPLVGAVGMASFATLDASSSYWHFFTGMMIVSVGIGLAMTPATTAIVSSLPLAKQGVASAVNDTARAVGGALGVAVLGSAFNTAYRSEITEHLGGLETQNASDAREAPALAFEIARRLGDDGNGLVVATQGAFESGLRAAVLISAALFALAALYTWWRGQDASGAVASDPDDGTVPVVEPAGLALEPSLGTTG